MLDKGEVLLSPTVFNNQTSTVSFTVLHFMAFGHTADVGGRVWEISLDLNLGNFKTDL